MLCLLTSESLCHRQSEDLFLLPAQKQPFVQKLLQLCHHGVPFEQVQSPRKDVPCRNYLHGCFRIPLMLQEKVLLPDALYNSHQLLVKKKKRNIQSKKQPCSEEKSGRTILVQWWSSHMAEITFVLLKQTLGFVWRAGALPPWSWCESATACTSPLLLMVRMCFLFTWYGVSRGR